MNQFAIPVRENNSDNTDRNVKLVWDQADIPYYQSVLQGLLSHIPKHALICNNQNCTDQRHNDDLETYYREIVNCLGTAGHLCGKCGDDNIAAEFTKYYQKVYQPNTPGAQSRMRSDVDDLLDIRRRQNDEFRDKIGTR